MASIERVMRLRSELEARLLRILVAAILLIAGLGILFGLSPVPQPSSSAASSRSSTSPSPG